MQGLGRYLALFIVMALLFYAYRLDRRNIVYPLCLLALLIAIVAIGVFIYEFW